MAKTTDIKLADDLDLLIKDGGFKNMDATAEHQKVLLLAEKGQFKQFPFVGVGIGSFLEDDNPGGMLKEIRKQFELDGMRVRKISITTAGKLELKATYQ